MSAHFCYYTRGDGEILGSLGYFCAVHKSDGTRRPCCGLAMARWETVENAGMAKTLAQRQADFRKSMKEAGFVLLTAYVTKEQREKFRQLGGDDWLRKKIDAAKNPTNGKPPG